MKNVAWELSGAVAVLAMLGCMSGCSAADDGEGESLGTSVEALSSCTLGWAFNGGTWRRKAMSGDACAQFPTTDFQFGESTDVPLMFNGALAVYGKTAERLGHFAIDRDNSKSWTSGDTWVKFRSDAQSGDQPFVILRTILGGPSCLPVGSGPVVVQGAVVGIKRGIKWYIDTNGNGVWDGTGPNNCDTEVANFGLASDLPVPIAEKLASTRPVGALRQWLVDQDDSLTWNSPPDVSVSFGDATFLPWADGWTHGTQDGRNVHVNLDSDPAWSGGDVAFSNYLSSSSWKFVGRTFWEEPPR